MKKVKRLMLVFAFIAACVAMQSCATYKTIKQDVVPHLSAGLIESSPNIAMAIWSDIESAFLWVVNQGESLFGYES